MLKFLLILSIIPFTLSMIEIQGKCPEIKVANKFNLPAFTTGLWYQVGRYVTDWEKQGDCVTMEFIPDANVIKFNITLITKGIPSYIIGVLHNPANATAAGFVDFDSPAFRDSEGREDLYVYILDTDNLNYAICYECRYNEKSNTALVAAWLLSREKKLIGDAKTAVDSYLKSSNIIDTKKFVWEHFTDEACQIKI